MTNSMRILLCIAGTPQAEAAVSFGGLIAHITRSPVTLLHVAPRKEEQAVGEETLARAREVLSGLLVDTHLRRGNPITNILAEARTGDYDLVVLGARREVGITQRLLGSVAQAVVRRAPTSVVVVKETRPDLKRVLICTGGAGVAESVIETGALLAGAARARATLLHVVSPTPTMYTGLDEIEETLPELLQADTPLARHLRHGAGVLDRHQVTAEIRLCQGVVADEILREAHQGDYDLTVIGASGAAGRLREWLMGNVTRQVVEYAPCSVLVAKRRPAGAANTGLD